MLVSIAVLMCAALWIEPTAPANFVVRVVAEDEETRSVHTPTRPMADDQPDDVSTPHPSGSCHGPRTEPLAGATVYVTTGPHPVSAPHATGRPAVLSCTTGPDGRCAVNLPPGAVAAVLVKADGHFSTAMSGVPIHPGPDPTEVTIITEVGADGDCGLSVPVSPKVRRVRRTRAQTDAAR